MCECTFCKAYDKYRWAVVMECKCICHDGYGITGHDGLCCEFPNALRRNNPHDHLKQAKHYKRIIKNFLNDHTTEKSL